MKKIVFPLKLQMKRPEVGNLHQALALIGLEVAAAEKDSQRFGASTREAVRRLQTEHQLDVTGAVDETTANVLNRLLAEHGALDEEIMYEVTGAVRSADGAPAAGLTVQAFDRDVSREELLGSAVTDGQGTYQIRFNEAQFKRTPSERGGPEVFIRVSGSDGQPLAQSKTVRNAPRLLQMDVKVPSAAFVVRGSVHDSDGRPGYKLIVRAFDRNVGAEDTLLGEATTDEQGNYSISYTSDQLGGKSVADLVICMFQDGKLLQTSDEFINAEQEVVQDFTIPIPAAPEFLRFTKTIQPLLRNEIGIGGLAQAQVNFLRQKTGIDAQKIGRLAQSHALAGGDQTLAAFYYGLLSQNLPTDPAALLSRPRESVQTALDRAAILNQIPRLQPEDIDTILQTTLPRLRAENLLKPAKIGQRASLGDLLKTMPRAQALSEDLKLKLADLVAQNGINHSQLPKQLEAAGFSTEQASGIERTLRLADITLSHPPLMRYLQQETATDPDGSLKALTELGRAQWIDLASTYGIPAGADQTPEAYANQLERAVDALHPTAMLAARLNSGDLVISRPGFEKAGLFLKNNPDFDILYSNIPEYAEEANFNGVENKEPLIKSLLKLQRIKRLSASWDETGALLNARLESALDIVGAGKGRLLQSLSDRVVAERVSDIYERARKVHDVSLVLMSGLLPRFSPTPIPAMGGATRMQELGTAKPRGAVVGDRCSATLQSLFASLDNAACDQTVLSPAAYYVDLLQFLNPKVDDKTRNPASLETLLWRRPDLIDLELSSNNSEIELPYIDLVLEILENAVAIYPLSFQLFRAPLEALQMDPWPNEITDALQSTSLGIIGSHPKAFKENPDQMQLTEDWGDTWMVDDSQRRWALRAPADDSNPIWQIESLTYQTTGKSEELIACPENQNPIAYEILRNPEAYGRSCFPWSLPFNLPWESVRACLNRAGISRRQLIEAGKPADYLGDMRWVCEMLNLSSEEAKMISDRALSPKVWQYWGFWPRWGSGANVDENSIVSIYDSSIDDDVKGTPLTVLSRVSILMQQARVSYDDLFRILRTHFFQPPLPVVTLEKPDGSACSPGNMNLNLTEHHPDILHRLIRLWRASGWAINDLDLAMCVFTGSQIGPDFLIFLSHIKRLQELLGVPVQELLSWWGSIGAATLCYAPHPQQEQPEPKNLYERIFLNPLAQSRLDPDFLLNRNRNGLKNTKVKLGDKSMYLSAVLGIRQEEINLLLSQSPLVDDTMTLDSLFWLYRTSGLIKALGISAVDFDILRSIVNFDTTKTASGDTAATIQFCETIQRIRSSGFTAEELAYLLETESNTGSALAVSDDQVSQQLAAIRSAMQATLNSVDRQVKDFIRSNPGGPTITSMLAGKDAVEAEAAWLAIPSQSSCGANNVTGSFKLPGACYGTTIEWASSDPKVIAIVNNSGCTVARPPVAGLDTPVTLTATISIDNPPAYSVVRSFPLVVLRELSPDEAVEADAESLDIGYQPGDSADRVTGFLQLPSSGNNRTAISWKSSNRTIIQDNEDKFPGKVTRPPNSGSDTSVILTAIIREDNPPKAKAAKTFKVTVARELTSDEIVAADADSLAIGFQAGDSAGSVRHDYLNLPARGPNATKVSWTSSNSAVISITNHPFDILCIANRPPADGSDTEVTLTATVVIDPASGKPASASPAIRSFTVVVPKQPTDDQAVAADAAALEIQYLSGEVHQATGFLNLPSNGINGTLIRWISSDSAVVEDSTTGNAGRFTRRPAGEPDAHVALTALVTKNNSSAGRIFLSQIFLDHDPFGSPEYVNLLMPLKDPDPNDPHALDIHSLLRDAIVSQAASLFNLESPMARMLLTTAILKDPSDSDRPALEVFFNWDFVKKNGVNTQAACALIQLLQKVSLIVSRLKIRPEELNWIAPPFGMRTLDFNLLPVSGKPTTAVVQDLCNGWLKLVVLIQCRDRIRGMGLLLGRYVAMLSADPPATQQDFPTLTALIGEGLGLPKEWDFCPITAAVGITDPDGCRNPIQLEEFINLLGAMKKLGATKADVDLLTQDWPQSNPGGPAPDPATQAQITARALLRAKFGAESWNGVIKPISDKLRSRQRDVLVDYLIFNTNNAEHPIRNANDLYEYYLIDPQMSPCMLTSRLVQATAAVQLFIQRCFLNLEPVRLTSDEQKRWEWMKNYRVWQANREVFLFPENWLFPELRDDKTETFKALESGLGQGEPKDQLAKENVLHYLDELNEISKITVYGMYDNVVTADSKGNSLPKPIRTLYIVGRSPDQPFNYYWRQCTAFGSLEKMKWSGWEQIMDITDDHVMPFVMDGDLHIAWPTIARKTDTTTTSTSDTHNSAVDPGVSDYWEIKLNWIRHTSKGWTKKKVTKEVLPNTDWPNQLKCQKKPYDSDKEITFRAGPYQSQLGTIDFHVYRNYWASDKPENTKDSYSPKIDITSNPFIESVRKQLTLSPMIPDDKKRLATACYKVINIIANYPNLRLADRRIVQFFIDNPDIFGNDIVGAILDHLLPDLRTIRDTLNLPESELNNRKETIVAAILDVIANPFSPFAPVFANWASNNNGYFDLPKDIAWFVVSNPKLIQLMHDDDSFLTCVRLIENIGLITPEDHSAWWNPEYFKTTFVVRPYTAYKSYDGKTTWYGPYTDKTDFYFDFYINESYCIRNRVVQKLDGNGKAYYEYSLDLIAFEKGHPTKAITRVEIYPVGTVSNTVPEDAKNLSALDQFIYDFQTEFAVVRTFDVELACSKPAPASWHLERAGRFILSAFGDVTFASSNYAVPRIDAKSSYANGYVWPAGNSLLLQTGMDTFTAKEITQEGFVVPAASSEAAESGVWYFEYPAVQSIWNDRLSPSIKAYIDGPRKNDEAITWLDIRDNVKMIPEVLRETAYLNFDGLFSADKQAPFGFPLNNLYLGGVAIDGKEIQPIYATGFDPQTPIAPYNWELFYHAPMLIAEYLTKQQRFADAQKWLHYIFNPTRPDCSSPTNGEAAQFWKFLPFRQLPGGESLQQLFNWLAETQAAESTNSTPNNAIDQSEVTKFKNLIEDWGNNPFLPFLVAREPIRWVSFEWHTVFAYLDNLVAWGDQMFRRFSRESVNEAIQYYVLAAKLLGPRPQSILPQAQPPALSYRDLHKKWDDFSNAWYVFTDAVSTMLMTRKSGLSQNQAGDIKVHDIPLLSTSDKDDADSILFPSAMESDANQNEISPVRPSYEIQPPYEDLDSECFPALSSLGMLYFGIPSNDKLMGYWDMVEDRLIKIRNCMDIDGVTRDLPLFAPPIDPMLLARAVAAGLSIDDALADMNAPLLPYRFNIVVQKANEICAEVKSLGSALLAALEKKDAEGLALLRSGQEVTLLDLITQVKQRQVNEANANIDSLNQSMAVTMARFTQYQKLLGKGIAVDSSGLPVLSAGSSLQLASNEAGDEAGLGLIQNEVDQLISLDEAHKWQEMAGITSTVAGLLHSIPEFQSGGIFAYLHMGGMHLGNAANTLAAYFNLLAGDASFDANRKEILGRYQRRQDDWVFQSKLALEEMKQINKQIIAAQIRLDISQRELHNHLTQIDNAQAVDDFMHDKYTNQELYSWMTGQISSVYFTCYQLAYDIAKRAEKAYRSELGLDDSSFIQFGYWDSLKKGLLTGENLSLDLKRMEVAYLEQNRRELEITRHISLLQLDPMALLKLKETGECEVSLPEVLFDLDFPGHYFRRIKSVSLSIPCVVGPYAGVNCTLTLLNHSCRKNAQSKPPYARNTDSVGKPADDSRFSDGSGTVQSIATSSAQNDSGLFELNFRDERYLPFEGAGAISTWRLELSGKWQSADGTIVELAQYDFDTISDVILHLRYTARDGGNLLKANAIDSLKQNLDAMMKLAENRGGFYRLFSLRREFPTEWNRFVTTPNSSPDHSQVFPLSKSRFPFLFQSQKIFITQIDIFGVPKESGTSPQLMLELTPPGQETNASPVDLQEEAPLGPLVCVRGSQLNIEVKDTGNNLADADWTFVVQEADVLACLDPLDDLLIVCRYRVGTH